MEVSIREIKFRGKRLDNGEWVCGCLTRYSNHMSYITVDLIENEVHEVSTATVGQFTGLCDKKNKEIYDGDVVRHWVDLGPGGEIVRTDAVVWMKTGINLQEWTFSENGYLPEVIGNIHDSPELLNAT